jgi:signal transduction histidine kinase
VSRRLPRNHRAPGPACAALTELRDGLLAVERCEGQNDEADAAQEQRDSNDDPEQSETVGHVGRVQRGRQRGLGHPDVADAVRDRLLAGRVDQGVLRVVRAAAQCELCLGRDSLLEDPEVNQDVTRRLGASTGLYVPLLARERPIGVLVAHDKMGPDPRFSSADLRLAEQFANRAAIAVDLSRRVARDALRRVVSGQELERRRLARELHDETGQALTSILLGLRAVEEAAGPDEMRTAASDLRELVVGTLQDVRRLAVQLRPKALDDFGLVAAVEHLVQTFSEATAIRVDLEAQLGDERLPTEVETTLYRMVQEALTNIVKHAGASRVSILLVRSSGSATVVIEDDGQGFDPAELREEGMGIVGMRERVELHEGRLTVESTPGSGATLVAEVPL